MGWAKKNVPGYKEVSNAVIDPISKPLERAATQVLQPIEKAIIQPIGQGLASFDKMVGKTIPGGWGTVASIAGSAMGLPTPALVGLGALTGSGVMRKGGSFNLQGALMGGVTAYASAKLGDYLRAAAPGAEGAMATLPESAVDLSSGVNAATGQVGSGLAGNASGMLVDPSTLTSANIAGLNSLSAPLEAGFGSGLQVAPPPSIGSQIMSRNFGDAISQIGSNIGDAASRAYTSAGEGLGSLGAKTTDTFQAAIDPSTYTNALETGMNNLSQTGSGIKNLITGPAGVSKTAAQLSGVDPVKMAGIAAFGATSVAALDDQRKFLEQQRAAGNIAQAEYDAAMAEINRQAAIARDTVNSSPFSTSPDRDVSIGDTYYGRSGSGDTLYARGSDNATLYAAGGSITDEMGFDDSPRGLGLGNLSNGFMNMGSTPYYAQGGNVSTEPRFLSGGGDGMSDSIPANINGTQEARLADGEFVIPADVVSHLGNGSSKAGAKQLYAMMDKVRKARTGSQRQGKQINPRKYLAA